MAEPGKPIEVLAAEQADAWSGVAPPNAAGAGFAAGLRSVLDGFAHVRGQLAFEDEPSSFEAALQATKERDP